MTTKDMWKEHVVRILPYKTALLWYIWSERYANEDMLHQHAAATLSKRAPSGDAKGECHRKSHL